MAEDKTASEGKEKMEERKIESQKTEIKPESTKAEAPKIEKAEPKKEEKKMTKKEEAIAKGNNLHVSMKQCMYICRFIKGKTIDQSIRELEGVLKLKTIIPFSGEIPHRKGKIMSGRYPINASKLFIPLLKTLRGNVLANQMDLDKTRIFFASSSFASRPSKRGGGRFKRANIILKAKEAIK